jgi:hypothetical protein
MSDELEVQRGVSTCRWVLGWVLFVAGATIIYTLRG